MGHVVTNVGLNTEPKLNERAAYYLKLAKHASM